MVSQTSYTADVQKRTLATAHKNGEYWTQSDLDALFQLFDEGHKLEDIAVALKRTYYAATSMHRLGYKEASEYIDSLRVASSSLKRVLPYDVPSSDLDFGDGW